MCSSRAMKFISVLAFVGILALGFTTLSFAQTSGQTPGVQPPQSSGDVSKDSAAPPKATAKPDSSFGQKPGMPAGQSMADPSKNSLKPGADSNVGNAPYPDYGKQGGTYNR